MCIFKRCYFNSNLRTKRYGKLLHLVDTRYKFIAALNDKNKDVKQLPICFVIWIENTISKNNFAFIERVSSRCPGRLSTVIKIYLKLKIETRFLNSTKISIFELVSFVVKSDNVELLLLRLQVPYYLRESALLENDF